jgi:hypothetical protein
MLAEYAQSEERRGDMSYDLILTSNASLTPERAHSLHQRLANTRILDFCEILEDRDQADVGIVEAEQDLLTVCLPGDEEIVRRVFAELKAIAGEYGLRLQDPQTGEDVDLHGNAALPEMF